MSNSPPTMVELAKQSGFSLATVSRALDHSKSHLLAPATREKILQCADALGFQVNQAARNLRTNRTGSIALLIPDHMIYGGNSGSDFSIHPVFANDINEAFRVSGEAGYDLKLYLIPRHFQAADEESLLNKLTTRYCDGVLVIGYSGSHFLPELTASGIPLVVINRETPLQISSHQVILDRTPGIVQAVDYLISQGRRSFGWISTKLNFGTLEKFKIYRDALKSNNLFRQDAVFEITDYYELRRLVDDGRLNSLDAVMCSNDTMANWLVRELRFLGRDVPENIAVVGYDGNPAYHGSAAPDLGTVMVPRAEMVRQGIKRLTEVMRGDGQLPKSKDSFETFFYKGSTC